MEEDKKSREDIMQELNEAAERFNNLILVAQRDYKIGTILLIAQNPLFRYGELNIGCKDFKR